MSLPRSPIVLLLSLLVLSRMNAAPQRHTFSHPCMGTVFFITLYASDEAVSQKAAEAAFQRIEDLNQIASDYLPESELSRFNSAPANETITVSNDLFRLIKLSLDTAKLTGGAFDITAAYAVQLWRRAKRQHKAPSPEQVAHAVAMTDWRALQLDEAKKTVTKKKPGLLLDLGGIGKGYAANEALLVLKQHGITRAIVAGSGDLAIGDAPPDKEGWDVALRTFEKPEDKDSLIHLTLHNCGCSTSGDLHQFLELDGKRYSHIIDPKTGLGLTDRIACTVIAPDAAMSDAFDTPLCIMGKDMGLKLIAGMNGFHARIVILEGDKPSVFTSPAFPKAVK